MRKTILLFSLIVFLISIAPSRPIRILTCAPPSCNPEPGHTFAIPRGWKFIRATIVIQPGKIHVFRMENCSISDDVFCVMSYGKRLIRVNNRSPMRILKIRLILTR